MAALTLDTSGFVYSVTFPADTGSPTPHGTFWSDLDPFTQGVAQKMLEEAQPLLDRFYGLTARDADAYFTDLAPETLAAILKDYADAGPIEPRAYNSDALRQMGADRWRTRQRGAYAVNGGLKPLTVSLGDDGKVRLS